MCWANQVLYGGGDYEPYHVRHDPVVGVAYRNWASLGCFKRAILGEEEQVRVVEGTVAMT